MSKQATYCSSTLIWQINSWHKTEMLTLLINLNESNILQVHFAKTARAVLGIVGNAGGNAGNGGENAGNAGGNAGNWDGNVGNQGDSSWGPSCLLLWLKFPSARWAFHHPIFMGSCPTISHTFFALSTNRMSSPSRKWGRGVNPRFYLLVFVFGVNQEN